MAKAATVKWGQRREPNTKEEAAELRSLRGNSELVLEMDLERTRVKSSRMIAWGSIAQHQRRNHEAARSAAKDAKETQQQRFLGVRHQTVEADEDAKMKHNAYASVRKHLVLPKFLARDQQKAVGASAREVAKASQQFYQKIQEVEKGTQKAKEACDTLAKETDLERTRAHNLRKAANASSREADLERTRAQNLWKAANASSGKALEMSKLLVVKKYERKKQVQVEYDLLVQQLRLEKTQAKQYQKKSAASAQEAETAHRWYELKVEELKTAKHACDTLAKQAEVDRTYAQNCRTAADATGVKAEEISQQLSVKETLLAELLQAVLL